MITTNAFIQDIKDRGLVPSTQNTISDNTLMAWANDENGLSVAPLIVKYNEDQMLVTTEHVPEKRVVWIPPRALGGNLIDIKVRLPGDEQHVIDPKRINRSNRDTSQYGYSDYAFYTEGNKLVFLQDFINDAIVELTYVRRPNKLVFESQSRKIVEIHPDGFVVNSMAPFITMGQAIDITSHQYNQLIGQDVMPTLVDPANKKVFCVNPDHLTVGDLVTLPETTAIVQLPEEYITLLAQRVNLRALMSIGDQAGQQAAMAVIKDMEHKLGTLVSTRIANKPIKLFNRNSFVTRGYAKGFAR